MINTTEKTAASRRRDDALKSKKRALRLVLLCFAACVVCYTVYETYAVNKSSVKTETAYEQTLYETLDMEILVLRDEQLFDCVSGGAVVSLASDGEKVARDAEIAAVFSSPENASKYVEAQRLRGELERCDALTSQAAYSGLKAGTLQKQTRNDFCAMLNNVYRGDMAAALEKAKTFRDDATTLDIITGGTLDIAKKREELSGSIATLESGIGEHTAVHTGINRAGYFMSTADGCESLVSYADALKLSASAVTKALAAAKSATVPANKSRLVCSCEWYIASALDSKKVSSLKVGDTVTLKLPYCEPDSIKAVISAKNEDTNGKAALIFSCNLIDSQLLSLRHGNAQIVLKAHTGYRVDNEAVRVLDIDGVQTRGVYILRGNIVSFRKLDEIYSGDGFVLSDSSAGSGYIQLYDEIITEGKGLSNGALID